MKLSVVIPTHNRAEILRECLKRLYLQDAEDFEVIVADDGSTDDTEVMIRDFQGSLPEGAPPLTYLKLPAVQQGAARNRGVEAASGDIVVFIGDDIFVEPGFLAIHLQRHTEYPDESVAVLGYTTWDPSLSVNPYMRFLEESGWQFGYRMLKPAMIGRLDPYKFFYTSNLSLKKSLLEKEGFDESFRGYGWEDIELGYRLCRNHELQIYYEPEARAYHHHEIPEADLECKMESVGASAVRFVRLHPQVRVMPVGLKARLIRALARPAVGRAVYHLHKPAGYRLLSWHAFFRGVDKMSL